MKNRERVSCYQMRAWLVHLYTSLGWVAGFLALIFIVT